MEVDSLEALAWDSDMVVTPLHVPRDGNLPLPGGSILEPGDLAPLGRAGAVVMGLVPASWEWLRDRVRLVEIMPRDDFALLNAVPTAEGALAEAMALSDRTLAWESASVLGFGRVGLIMADRLRGLGSRVTVVARSARDLAAAEALGYRVISLPDLAGEIRKHLYVFNTIPAPVLSENVLENARPGTIIIDLASKPGGTDFQAASSLGLIAKLCPALPGRVTPVSAGHIVARVILRLASELGCGGAG